MAIRVRLTGRAATTFRRLPEATRADFSAATNALQKRFEPESKKELYMAEMQTRSLNTTEDWAVFGEELKRLADKAYPDLQEEARERLALNQYLARLEHPQLAFSVRQNKPMCVDEAVRITLEMETYLQASKSAMPVQIAHVDETEEEAAAVTAVASTKWEDPLQMILRRMEKLEADLKSVHQQGPPRSKSRGPNRSRPKTTICWNCRGEDHIAPKLSLSITEDEAAGKRTTLGAVSRAPEGDSPAHETLNGKGRGTDNGNGLGNGNGHGRVHDDGDQREASITAVALESASWRDQSTAFRQRSWLILEMQLCFSLEGCGIKLAAKTHWRVCKAANSLAYKVSLLTCMVLHSYRYS